MVASPYKVRKIINEFIRTLESDIKVERVILYGSYAHRNAREWSDIDLAILSSDFSRMSEIRKTDFLARKLVRCDWRLMPIAYTPDYFDNAPPYLFASEIRRTGKVVYDARKRRKKTAKRKVGR